MSATTSRTRVVIGYVLVAAAAVLIGALVASPTPPPRGARRQFPNPHRSYALGYAHLAELPGAAEITRESRDGWHL